MPRKKPKKNPLSRDESSEWLSEAVPSKGSGLKVHWFVGIALGGGKTDKSSLSLVEYYPDAGKVFLSRLFSKIRSKNQESGDKQIHDLVTRTPGQIESVAFDAPLQMPKCIRCQLICPGYETCKEPEIQWLRDHYSAINEKKRPKKFFTPYTERCVEAYLHHNLEEKFSPSHALGANAAPLAARAHFIGRRLTIPLMEVSPKVSLWRIGSSLQIAKSHLRFHRHAMGGEESRLAIIEHLVKLEVIFLYHQDSKVLIENSQAFDSFICALTAVLAFRGDCEPRPEGFPSKESWIQIPKKNIDWTFGLRP